MQQDEAIRHYYSLNPAQFHDFVQLSIKQQWLDGQVEIIVDLELRQSNTNIPKILYFRFSGVQNIKYIPSEASTLHFGFIDIVCIEEYGWENIRYKVFETEQDTKFSFLCREFFTWCEQENKT